ncbi:MAG: type II toxin-antitoxin system RelE/ParE family toxin [Bacillota bacterium]|nr:type II toxin-antitoxin system RelE/ParE family toxin [Bacillota bacterium]
MIKSFADKDTENIWKQQWTNKFPEEVQKIAFRKLIMIHSSTSLNDLMVPPGNRLEKLKGKQLGQMSVRINKQYRICFTWYNSNAYEVKITGYH